MSNPVLRPNPRLTRRLYTGRRQLLFYFAGTNNLYLVDDPRCGWTRVATTPAGGTRMVVANGFVTCGPSRGYGTAMWRCKVGDWGNTYAYTVPGGTSLGASNGDWTVLNGGVSDATFLVSRGGINYSTYTSTFPTNMDRVADFAVTSDGRVIGGFYDQAGVFGASDGWYLMRPGASPLSLVTINLQADFGVCGTDFVGATYFLRTGGGGGTLWTFTGNAANALIAGSPTLTGTSFGVVAGSVFAQVNTATSVATFDLSNPSAAQKTYQAGASANLSNATGTQQSDWNGVEFVVYDSGTHSLHVIDEGANGFRVPLPGSAETGLCACTCIPN